MSTLDWMLQQGELFEVIKKGHFKQICQIII